MRTRSGDVLRYERVLHPLEPTMPRPAIGSIDGRGFGPLGAILGLIMALFGVALVLEEGDVLTVGPEASQETGVAIVS